MLEKKNSELSHRHTFWLLLASVTILRLIVSCLFPLAMDEAYYWDWSRNISLSYYDHPPFIAYLIYLTGALFGTNIFSIRLGAVLFGSGCIYIVYRMTRDLFGSERAGLYAAIITTAIPIYGVGGIIITPDVPQAFFWLLSLYLYYYATENGGVKTWLLAGITTGLCLLSKYTGLFLIPCFGLYLLLSPKKRRWIIRYEPYLSLLIAFCVFSPVIIWNASHEWISFGFQFSHGFSQKVSPGIKGLFEYLGTQAGIISPLLFIGVLGGALAAGHLGRKKGKDVYLFLFAISFPVFFFFTLLSMKSRLEANWPILSYFGGIVAVSGFYDELKKRGKIKPWLKKCAIISNSMGFLLIALLYFFTVKPLIIFPKIEEVHFGWESLGREVGNILNDTSDTDKKTFIFSDLHQITAELAFYVEGRPKTYQIEGKKRYDYGPELSYLKGLNGLYVSFKDKEVEKVKKFFKSTELVKILPIQRSGKILKTYKIYKCYDYKGGLIEV